MAGADPMSLGSGHHAHLVELDGIPGRVVDECLAVASDDDGVADLEALGAQLLHHRIEIKDLDGEVLTDVGRHRSFDEMDLLGAEVDPRAPIPKSGRSSRKVPPRTPV